jgi:hypothetical protein
LMPDGGARTRKFAYVHDPSGSSKKV